MVRSKPANGRGPGLESFNPASLDPASLFLFSSSVVRISDLTIFAFVCFLTETYFVLLRIVAPVGFSICFITVICQCVRNKGTKAYGRSQPDKSPYESNCIRGAFRYSELTPSLKLFSLVRAAFHHWQRWCSGRAEPKRCWRQWDSAPVLEPNSFRWRIEWRKTVTR